MVGLPVESFGFKALNMNHYKSLQYNLWMPPQRSVRFELYCLLCEGWGFRDLQSCCFECKVASSLKPKACLQPVSEMLHVIPFLRFFLFSGSFEGLGRAVWRRILDDPTIMVIVSRSDS